MKRFWSSALRYLIPLATFIVLLMVARSLRAVPALGLPITLLIIGLMVASAWYAGRGPGLLVMLVFEATIDYYAPGPIRSWQFASAFLSRLVIFSAVVLFASSRKKAEADLRESRELLKVTLSSIGDAVLATDQQGFITFLNPFAESLTGWSQAEALGRHLDQVFRIINEQTRQPVASPVTKVLGTGAISALANHTLLIRKDGAEVPIDDSGAPIRDRDGNLAGVVLVFRDITERRRAEQERAHLAAIVGSSADAIISKGTDGVIESWNNGAERLYGYTSEEVVGKLVSILMPPDRADDFPEIMGRLNRGERIEHLETVRISKTGKLIDVSLTISPIRDGEGNVVGASAIARDISARKKAERALAETLEHLRIVTDAMAAPVSRCSRDMRYLWVSQRFADWLGRRPEDIVGHSVVEIIGSDALSAIRPYVDRVLAGEVVRYEQQVNYQVMGPRWINAIYTPTFDQQGAPDGWVAVVIDIDERKRYEQVLQQANQLKDEFLATVSHELRTPLNAMLGWAKLLRRGNLDPEASGRALTIIERNALAQTQLIEDLLDVSRIISGKMRLDVTAVELSSVIQEAVDSVRPAVEAKEIRLQIAEDSMPCIVSGDPGRLQQVIWNLLSNSAKFTPTGGEIQVRLEQSKTHVKVVVKDTGKGISPEFLPYIFDRFRQADSSLTRAVGGLGLGLSIVQSLVELHGGWVRVESPGEGLGATFTVELPLITAPSSRELAGAQSQIVDGQLPAGEMASLDGIRVLVVDDEPEARELLGAILNQCQATVTTASSASEALEAFAASQPDVLVSDIGMPGGDGYRLMETIRSAETRPNGKSVAAIALTAHVGAHDRLRALSAGYQVHLGKPVDPVELTAVIANLVTTGRGIG